MKLLQFLVVLLAALPAMASEEGQQSWTTIALHGVNLALIVGAAIYFLKQPTKRALKAKAAEVEAALKEAEEKLAESQALLAQSEARVSGIEKEVASFLEKSRAESEAEREAIIEAARKEVSRVLKEAALTADQELAALRLRLKDELCDRAVGEAMAKLQAELSDKDRARLADEAIADLAHEAPKAPLALESPRVEASENPQSSEGEATKATPDA